MAEIELTDDLILLQKRSDTAWARLREIQDRHGRPAQAGGWSHEAEAEWQNAREQWGERIDSVRAGIDTWARESGQRRIDIETRLKGTVRAGKDPQVWPDAE
ncbi:hypothetical protein [Streptomyces sp. NBC_01565]|uniref:hypothetical protein n=1 Tax=Streptomyces sp. NBC_01565 TaxID=2975881 RepID=UPI00224E5BB8|nr:hypothetical protein [Streptomyces sp. NBC_01565]MCX4546646.1 hypothetical protein [Streptomyces sp. NBC_01565]